MPAKAELFRVVLLLPRNQSHFLPVYVLFPRRPLRNKAGTQMVQAALGLNPGNVDGRPSRYSFFIFSFFSLIG